MKFAKGFDSVKSVDGVIVLFSACSLMMLYICTKFYENILNGNKVIEQTRFALEIFFSARHMIVVYISSKFHEKILVSKL